MLPGDAAVAVVAAVAREANQMVWNRVKMS